MERLLPQAWVLVLLGLITLSLPSRASAQLRASRMLTAEAAQRVLGAAEAKARTNGWTVSIAVVDAAGDLMAFLRRDGASPASVDIARAKARTAARFRRPTKALEDAATGGRTVLLSFEGVTLVEGGVPIVVNGEVVGAVGVSGVMSPQDAQVAQAGANAVKP
jgi:glc operon protein GlcG